MGGEVKKGGGCNIIELSALQLMPYCAAILGSSILGETSITQDQDRECKQRTSSSKKPESCNVAQELI
jgi:hypothetical protein